MPIPATGHTIKRFDEELSTLRDLVLRMGGQVEEQLRRALLALESNDVAIAKDVVTGDREIDRIELKADEEVVHLIAIRTPLGVDLRTVITLAKTVNDLERMGDEAKKVARVAIAVSEAGARHELAPVLALGRDAAEALHGALDALVRLDLSRAALVRQADAATDQACNTAIAALSEAMQGDPALVAPGIDLLFAAKALERIGDHAKNIAQYVVYLVEGRDIRHPKVNPNR